MLKNLTPHKTGLIAVFAYIPVAIIVGILMFPEMNATSFSFLDTLLYVSIFLGLPLFPILFLLYLLAVDSFPLSGESIESAALLIAVISVFINLRFLYKLTIKSLPDLTGNYSCKKSLQSIAFVIGGFILTNIVMYWFVFQILSAKI